MSGVRPLFICALMSAPFSTRRSDMSSLPAQYKPRPRIKFYVKQFKCNSVHVIPVLKQTIKHSVVPSSKLGLKKAENEPLLVSQV